MATSDGRRVSNTLLDKVANGEPDAVSACIDKYGRLVWTLARRFLRDAADAEDAVQEIFIDLWKNAGRFDPHRSAESTFVTMVARRRLIDRYRRVSRGPDVDALAPEIAAEQPEVGEHLEIREEAESVRSHMKQLKPDERLVLELAIVHGASQNQIADSLNMPLGTVKSHARRGMNRLRELATRTAKGGAS